MTERDFCYWLQGYFELLDSDSRNDAVKPSLSTAQVEIIKDHLNLVFHKITPNRHEDFIGHLTCSSGTSLEGLKLDGIKQIDNYYTGGSPRRALGPARYDDLLNPICSNQMNQEAKPEYEKQDSSELTNMLNEAELKHQEKQQELIKSYEKNNRTLDEALKGQCGGMGRDHIKRGPTKPKFTKRYCDSIKC